MRNKKILVCLLINIIILILTFTFGYHYGSKRNPEIVKIMPNKILVKERIVPIIVEKAVAESEVIIDKENFKSYMSYEAITSKSSNQYKLVNSDKAYTNQDNGLRMVDNRYCIAIGSGWGAIIGSHIDLVLENGIIIECIMSDQKSDEHTDENNKVCLSNGSIAEFLVDSKVFNKYKDDSGTVNFIEGFDSKIIEVIIY